MKEFQKLYEENFIKVYYYVRNLCENERLAEDLTQEAFYHALLHICTGKNVRVCTSWLIRIAHNVFIDYVRKNRIELSLDAVYENERTGTVFDGVFKLQLEEILKKLPVRYRSIILLKDHYGFSYEEISEIMSCSESTVKVTLHRARKRFKEVYQSYEREVLE